MTCTCAFYPFVHVQIISETLLFETGFGIDGKVFWRYLEDCVVDILLDPTFQDCIDYEAKPLFQDGERIFGPLRSGMEWEELQEKYPHKTIVPVQVYTDGTEFMKGSGAHPMFGNYTGIVLLQLLCVHCIL